MKNTMLYEALLKAYNVAEGQFSGIPDCCIREFNEGRTYAEVKNSLKTVKERNAFVEAWDYVPCKACLKKGSGGKVRDGHSPCGDSILNLMQKVLKQDEENTDN
jgi:hypothetical protein